MWHLTFNTWHATHDTWHVGGCEPSLKISSPYLLQFGSEDVLKIWRKTKGLNRGLTEEYTQSGIITPIGYFTYPIRDILSKLLDFFL